jgi:hypothetical protein
MTIKTSTGLRNALLSGGSFRDTFNGLGEIRIYAGAVPQSADESVGAATLLVTIMNGASGIGFEADAVNGILQKSTTETWEGTVVPAAGGGMNATFYRHVLTADTDDASATAPRYQGNVAVVGADMNLTSTSLVAGAVQGIYYHAVTIATA